MNDISNTIATAVEEQNATTNEMARNVGEARAHLEKAIQLAPGAEHIHYALALALGLSGDFAGAHENLRIAIELEPRNRMIARQDADFAPLAHQSNIRALLYPEKKSSW